MPPAKMMGDGRKAKDPKKTFLRLLGYMKPYIPNLIIVMLCIVITAFAQTRGSENIGHLVDDYILPMVESGSTDFGPLMNYLTGILAMCVNGEDPETCDPNAHNCGGECSSCSGCH